jgi:hypothetical protein
VTFAGGGVGGAGGLSIGPGAGGSLGSGLGPGGSFTGAFSPGSLAPTAKGRCRLRMFWGSPHLRLQVDLTVSQASVLPAVRIAHPVRQETAALRDVLALMSAVGQHRLFRLEFGLCPLQLNYQASVTHWHLRPDADMPSHWITVDLRASFSRIQPASVQATRSCCAD